jgi:hypothetical protein
VSDKDPTKRALRRALIGLVAVAALVVPALGSAAVFEGSQTDPADDVLSYDINGPGFPRTVGPGTMDLSSASVRYDSGAGLLSFTFSGTAFVYSHSGTEFSGWISSIAHQPAGLSPCALSGEVLSFTGTSSTGSGGGPGYGTTTLSVIGSGDDTAPPIPGTVSFPVDWPEFSNVVTFTFLSPRLAHHTYQCAFGLMANYGDHGVRNIDSIREFCIVAGCFDPLGSATPPPAPEPPVVEPLVPALVVTPPAPMVNSQVVTALGPLAPVSDPARCLILTGKIKSTTARMKLMQRASHKGSKSHRRAVTRQARLLASRRTTLRGTYKALCT